MGFKMKRLGMLRGVNQGFWSRLGTLRVLRMRVFVSLRVAIDEIKTDLCLSAWK